METKIEEGATGRRRGRFKSAGGSGGRGQV